MKQSFKTGFSFGLTSGIITTLGLIVGLHSGTHSQLVILGGILAIAIADAFSDAMGIHISEEAKNKFTQKEVWEATLATFASKFIFALTFIAPILLLSLFPAIIFSIIWGFLLIGTFSFFMARQQGKNPPPVILEHLTIAILVVLITHFVGDWVSTLR
jgi:VIT1/CCC1 family predicted Fe2+/Mn2+ transporter